MNWEYLSYVIDDLKRRVDAIEDRFREIDKEKEVRIQGNRYQYESVRYKPEHIAKHFTLK